MVACLDETWSNQLHIEIERTVTQGAHLHQEAWLDAVLLLQTLCKVVKHADEAGADGLALRLRVHHALRAAKCRSRRFG